MYRPECILDAKASLAEGPLWSVAEQKLYWVDIAAPALHRFNPADGSDESWPMPESISCVALGANGMVIATMRSGIYKLGLSTNERQLIAEADYDPAQLRFNDGKCDRAGRLWVGTLDEQRLPNGALYCVGLDGTLQRRVDGVVVSNGLAWSPDNKIMYHADTRAFTVWQYDYDITTSGISNKRTFVDLTHSQEKPDGAAVDSAGNYWIAIYSHGKVVQFSPSGERLQEITVPAHHPTMVCFGGKDLQTLYITSARENLTPKEIEQYPQAGGIFAVHVDTPGSPEPFCKIQLH